MSYFHGIHFSAEEANDLLLEIGPLMEELTGLKKSLDDKGYDIFNHQYFGGSGPNGTGAFPEEMEMLVEIVKTVTAFGVQIKGIGNGLIDFPHIRKSGEEVYLCWKLGEDKIQYWHTIPEGYNGRINISEL